MFQKWFGEFASSVKSRHITNRRELKSKQKVFTALKCNVELGIAKKYVVLHSEGNYLKKAWKALQMHQIDME